MLTALRKFFGLVALVWLGWVALNTLIFGLYMASAMVEGAHGSVTRSTTLRDAAQIVAGMFLVSLFTAWLGVPSCLVWGGLKLVQVLSQPKVVYIPGGPESPAPGSEPWPSAANRNRATAASLSSAQARDPAPSGAGVYTYSAPGMPVCPECRRLPVILFCGPHNRSVCLKCLREHDRPDECYYIPAWRSGKPEAREGTPSGSTKTPRKPKPGDVFGIS